jgi:SAM-dependent methyltransferase
MWGAEDGESGGFRFNFGGDADAAAAKAPNPDVAARALDVDPKEGGHIAGVEVLASSVPEHSPTWKPETLELDPSTTVVKGAVTSADAANALSDADGSIASQYDVVKGRYEGGFKLWECSVDLAKHLLKHADVGDDDDDDAGVKLRGARVLELGCGHGVPGIVAALKGAAQVTLCDYNPEVLTTLAVPNVRANFTTDEARGKFAYLGGDWGDLDAHIQPGSFDLVLAAETIYSVDSYARHIRVLRRALRVGTGVALIAAKSYYFGVGGGVDAFRQAIERAHPDMEVKSVESFSDGASNVREILRVRYKRR